MWGKQCSIQSQTACTHWKILHLGEHFYTSGCDDCDTYISDIHQCHRQALHPRCRIKQSTTDSGVLNNCRLGLDLDCLIFKNATWTSSWISPRDRGMRNWGGGGGGEEGKSATVVTEHLDINPRYREIHKSAADEIACFHSEPSSSKSSSSELL